MPIPANCDTLVLELDSLTQVALNRLLELASSEPNILVIYKFVPRAVIQQLEQAGMRCIKAPVSDSELMQFLNFTPQAPRNDQPPARFATEELARIAALSPSLACECPNHIAKLLMDISSFEQYSQECVDTDPSEQALHQQLCRISGQARQLFEDALITVAVADGLPLNTK